MKGPEQDQLVQEYDSSLDNYLASNSWGHYDKDNKWGSDLVFTGRAVREWILDKMIDLIKPVLEEGELLTTEGLDHPTPENKNITYKLLNKKEGKIAEFLAITQIYKAGTKYYYKIVPSDNGNLLDFSIEEMNTIYSKSFSLKMSKDGTSEYYIIIKDHTLSRVSNGYFDYTDQFLSHTTLTQEEDSVNHNYYVYHYHRDTTNIETNLTITIQ